MMKTPLHLSLCIAALFAAASCGKEACDALSAPGTNLVPVTINAYTPTTRTYLDGVSPTWDEGDEIGVFTTDRTLCPAFDTNDGGSVQTSFSGMKPEGSRLCVAFYPFDSTAGFDGSALQLTLPNTQSGSEAEAVMAATGNETDGFLFENVCCLLKMSVPAGLDLRKIEVYRDDQVTGSFSVKTTQSPFTVSGTSTLAAYQDQRATLSSNSSAIRGVRYLSVLPSTSTRLEMALTNAAGKVGFIATDFSSGVPYGAGRLKNLGTLPTGIAFQDAALVANPTNQQL